MPAPSVAAMPPELHLPAGYVIRLSALDPTTGNAVAGVRVKQFSLVVTDVVGGTGEGLVTGAWQLVPGPGA